jgi:hypothetical protein
LKILFGLVLSEVSPPGGEADAAENRKAGALAALAIYRSARSRICRWQSYDGKAMIRRQAAAWLFGAFAKLSISPSSSPFSRVFPGQTGYAMPAVVVLIHGAGTMA